MKSVIIGIVVSCIGLSLALAYGTGKHDGRNQRSHRGAHAEEIAEIDHWRERAEAAEEKLAELNKLAREMSGRDIDIEILLSDSEELAQSAYRAVNKNYDIQIMALKSIFQIYRDKYTTEREKVERVEVYAKSLDNPAYKKAILGLISDKKTGEKNDMGRR